MSPVRDHTGIVIDTFNGLWRRGDVDKTPIDHFSDGVNFDFKGNSFLTRPGVGISQNVLIPLNNIKRIYNYQTQQANTLLVLTYDGTNGKIYHLVDSATVYGPILTVAGMVDFAFTPYAGRAYLSPFSSSRPVLSSPAVLVAAVVAGAGVTAGAHNYAVSFVNPSGETSPSPLTTVTTLAQLANPTTIPLLTDLGASGSHQLVTGATYKWLFVYSRDGLLTNVGTASSGFVAPAVNHTIGLESDSAFPSGSTLVAIYRTVANGATFFLEFSAAASPYIPQNGSGTYWIVGGTLNDTQLALQPAAPSSNSTQEQKVNLNSISLGPATVTARNIYRTAAGGTQLKLLKNLPDNTTTLFVDTTADASLGANAPTANTAYTGTNLIQKGISGEFVYVYAGDGTAARKAAGSGMTGTMSITNGAAGHTDPGQHVFGIVSQTISGYNSPPTILTAFVTSAASSVSFGSIPTSGDPNVVKRLLVATKAISLYNGNVAGYQFFFVPNAVINNNSDTFINNVSFYDADLLADASHLLQNYTSIPAGAVLSEYHNRLIVAATNTDISLALVSQPGEPEAINQISGLIVFPLDGNPITNAQELRDVLYMFKRSRTIAYADNGGDPSSWLPIFIDDALGTSVHGIATVLDSGSASVDFLIIATYQGISQFNGRFVIPEMSWKISDYWKNLDRNNFNLIQIINAPVQKRIYCTLPSRNLLVGNYDNGMDWKNIRWAPWSFLSGVNAIAIQNTNDIILGADYG